MCPSVIADSVRTTHGKLRCLFGLRQVDNNVAAGRQHARKDRKMVMELLIIVLLHLIVSRPYHLRHRHEHPIIVVIGLMPSAGEILIILPRI